MAELVLGLWVATAFVGAYMFSHTLGAARSRAEAEPGQATTKLPASVLFAHPFVHLAGLTTWIAYMAADERALAWTTLGILVVGAGLGELLLIRTLKGRKEAERTVEDRIPPVAMVTHGLLATATIGVVLLVSLGVGVDEDDEEYVVDAAATSIR